MNLPQTEEEWDEVRKLLLVDTIKETKEFIEHVQKTIEVYGTPFVCNECRLDFLSRN